MRRCSPRWQTLTACAVAVWLQGCASPPVTVADAGMWPFKELRVRTTAEEPINVYLSRGLRESRRLAIVLQAPPCEQESAASEAAPVSTAGVFWEQFKFDAAFLQFERPGGSPAGAERRTECTQGSRRGLTVDRWSRAASEAVDAIRAHEGLDDAPSIYVGAGEGALPAALLAAADHRASALILMSASGFSQHLEWLIGALHANAEYLQATNQRTSALAGRSANLISQARAIPAIDLQAGRSDLYWRSVLERRLSSVVATRPDLPVMIVHGIQDEHAPVEAALALFSELDRQGRPLAMLAVRHASRDLGLSGAHPDCFEAVVRAVAAQLDRWSHREARLSSELVAMDCSRVEGGEEQRGS